MSQIDGHDAMTAFDTTPRKALTDQQRAKLFLDAGGKCAVCTRKIRVGEKWHDDHIVALMNGGGNEITNRRVICYWCHKGKTKEDHRTAAKGRAVATKHFVPRTQRDERRGFRGWRKFNGQVVYARQKRLDLD